MSKRLILMRHAEAESPESMNDFERNLTTKGIQEAAIIGERLLSYDIDLMAVSASQRTQSTAKILNERLDLSRSKVHAHQELYNASVRALLNFVNWVDDDVQTLMIIAHNPGISYFAEYLSKDLVEYYKPANLTILEVHRDKWINVNENSANLVEYITPYN